MRYGIPLLVAALSIGSSRPAVAQVPDWVNQILTAAQLPVVTAEARREGVNDEEIRGVLDAMSKAKVPAHEATAVIDTARAVRREHGPVDNFGAFVQAQLASGKRGRELAAAIRAEHRRAGKGKGAAAGGSRADSVSDTTRGRGKAQQPGRPASADTAKNKSQAGRKPAKPTR